MSNFFFLKTPHNTWADERSSTRWHLSDVCHRVCVRAHRYRYMLILGCFFLSDALFSTLLNVDRLTRTFLRENEKKNVLYVYYFFTLHKRMITIWDVKIVLCDNGSMTNLHTCMKSSSAWCMVCEAATKVRQCYREICKLSTHNYTQDNHVTLFSINK